MKYNSRAIPEPSKGVDFSDEVSITVPNQALSLKDILERFTRGEPVAVGKQANWDEEADTESSIDYEKLATADLVDKAEYVNHLRDVKRKYDKQEKDKEIAKKATELKAKEEAEKLAKAKESSVKEDSSL